RGASPRRHRRGERGGAFVLGRRRWAGLRQADCSWNGVYRAQRGSLRSSWIRTAFKRIRMGTPQCMTTLEEVEEILSTDGGSNEVRTLLARGARPEEFVEMFVRRARPAQAAVAKFEFAEL